MDRAAWWAGAVYMLDGAAITLVAVFAASEIGKRQLDANLNRNALQAFADGFTRDRLCTLSLLAVPIFRRERRI
jgi:hypothetical protein